MKILLAQDEEIKASYFFENVKNKEYSDDSNKSILTNRRLIVIYRNSEENYPLSKITAVKVVDLQKRWLILVGAIIALIFFPIGAYGMGGGEKMPLFIVGVICLLIGLRKRTALAINQMGGEKKYLVNKLDEELKVFITAVNHSLI